jgi:hypothetical protein
MKFLKRIGCAIVALFGIVIGILHECGVLRIYLERRELISLEHTEVDAPPIAGSQVAWIQSAGKSPTVVRAIIQPMIRDDGEDYSTMAAMPRPRVASGAHV